MVIQDNAPDNDLSANDRKQYPTGKENHFMPDEHLEPVSITNSKTLSCLPITSHY
jgi:hypothetical protein